MSTTKTAIFFLGATGYIGGAILTRLLNHPSASKLDITALVRNSEKARRLESFGIKTVIGSHSDLDKLETLSSQAHIVISCSDSDDLRAIQAVLAGLRKRHASVGQPPILIHTSGTGERARLCCLLVWTILKWLYTTIGVLVDDAKGMYATDVIYSDMDVAQIESIPPTALHRNVDLAVVEADQQGYARTYIVLPSVVYGLASGPLVEAGISNPQSIQIPAYINASLDRKQGGVLGAGKAIWPNVNVDDVADLYIILLDAIAEDPERVGHGRAGFYFGENGEHTGYDISRAIAQALVELGVSKSAEPTPYTTEELVKYWGSEPAGNYNGTNSRCRADRARSIGWKPVNTTADMLAGIKPEVELMYKKAQEKGGVNIVLRSAHLFPVN
ncbi:hypothetical protein AcW2_005133 [Taiwanofungus camphoratus]|nr:hypothetical protein AcW2_005133 [Antrodia cinnamomea]